MMIDSRAFTGNMSLAQMALYSVMGFPLIIKGPLDHLDDVKTDILKHPALLSIHQDGLGQAGHRIAGHFYNGIQIYVRRLVNQRLAGESERETRVS